jgi:hypothetical protein
MNQLSQLAKSKQGKDLLDKAKTFANDPKTREKIEGARGKFNETVETAKQKMAEKKASDGSDTPTQGEPGAPGAGPAYGETSEPATQPASGGQGVHEEPGAGSQEVPSGGPTYGEEEGDKPLYGEDGPKAA